MKLGAILSLGLSLILTAPAWAAQDTASLDSGSTNEMNLNDLEPQTESNLHPRIVPQIGMSSLQYTGENGGAAGQAISGGVTMELGSTKERLLETGILLLRTSGSANVGPLGTSEIINTSQIAIPMMAKIRVVHLKSQAWYVKFGGTTTFEASSNDSAVTNPFDVLVGAGIGARMPISRKTDLLLEATYNHGLIDALRGGPGVEDGVLFFTGLSFGI